MFSRRTCREEVTRKIEQMVVEVELTEIMESRYGMDLFWLGLSFTSGLNVKTAMRV